MSDEQTQLLQAILDAVKEQTAVTTHYRDEAMALQHTVLARQKKMLRIVFLFLGAMLGYLAYLQAK